MRSTRSSDAATPAANYAANVGPLRFPRLSKLADIEDQVSRLDEEVRKVKAELAAVGKEADRQDFLSQEAVYSQFARDVAGAATAAKRLAIVNATARQFDPRLGDAAVREYWLARVRGLTDLEIKVLHIVIEHGRIAFNPEGLVPLNLEPFVQITLRAEERVAYRAGASLLAKAAEPLLEQGHQSYTMPGASFSYSGETFALSEVGKVVKQYLEN